MSCANEILSDVHGPKCFWINDGPVVKNIQEMPKILKKITKKQFSHHVNSDRNDFAKWVDDVLNDGKLAKSLKRVKTKLTTIKRIDARIKELKGMIVDK